MISSATISDDVLLRGEIRAMYQKKYHCDKDVQKLSERLHGDAPEHYKMALREKIALRAKTKGCGYVLKTPIDTINNIKYKTCLCKIKHPLTYDLMYMTSQASKGIMPFSGGLLDQPSQIIELMRIVEDAKLKEEDHLHKQNSKGSK